LGYFQTIGVVTAFLLSPSFLFPDRLVIWAKTKKPPKGLEPHEGFFLKAPETPFSFPTSSTIRV
jgi:hypothetical protein